jgi:tRNA G10  N-methylase Trm11
MVLGGDVDAGALAAALVNAGRQPVLARWDATRLPLRDRCVDVVITNPPYGRQHEALPGIERLYGRAMREAARVLRPDGRCVVLTGEPDAMLRALPPPLRVRSKRRLLLRGLSVTAFVMVRA